MKRSDYTLCLALSLSLIAHGMGLFTITQNYLRHLTWALLHPAPPEREGDKRSEQSGIPDTPQITVRPPSEQNVEGEVGGQGTGFNSSPGEQPMRALQAESDQAYISHNAAAPSAGAQAGNQGQNGQNGGGAVPQEARMAEMMALLPQATREAAPVGLPFTPPPAPVLRQTQNILAEKFPPAPPPPPQPPTEPPQKIDPSHSPAAIGQPPQSTAAQAPSHETAQPHEGESGRPGATARGGDGGNPGQAESDPFTIKNFDVVYVNGRVTARNGRVKRSYRVYLNDAEEFALMSMKEPSVVLKAKLDAQGRVILVTIMKSSGSDDVDLAAHLCLEKWEFEPAHDAGGQAIGDEIVIPFLWIFR